MNDWQLFGVAWSAMAVAAIALALPGLIVVARGQIMLAIAASQSAAAGAAGVMYGIGVVNGAHSHNDWRVHAGAMLGGLLGTCFAWQGSSDRVAWLFASTSAATVLFIAHSPYGMHDIIALQHSNALVADNSSLIFFIVLAVLGVTMMLCWHRPLRLLAIDPQHATSCGLKRRRWELLLGCWLGLTISMAVSTFGLLVSFCWLIVPAMIAARLAPSLAPIMIITPLIATLITVVGITLGHLRDIPPGQTIAATLAVVYILAVLWQLLRTALPTRSNKRPSPDNGQQEALDLQQPSD